MYIHDLSLSLSLYLSIYLSIYLSVYLSISISPRLPDSYCVNWAPEAAAADSS